MRRLLIVLLTASLGGLAQRPTIVSNGVVNSASFAQPVAPGSLVTIFGTNLAAVTQTATELPLPRSLGGTSVTVNGAVAPLLYISPTQINLQLPTSIPLAPARQPAYSIQVNTLSGSSSSTAIAVAEIAPGLFSANGSGCGFAAALNIGTNGALSVNSPSNSAAPGDYVALFGTGLGTVASPPPDGTAATGAISLITGIDVSVGTLGTVYSYAGVAPGLVGVNQVNVRLSADAPEACAVPVAVDDGAVVALSIHHGRGQCVDPPVQSYGRIVLLRTLSLTTGSEGETDSGSASFLSGPGVQPPPITFPDQPAPTRDCVLPGNSKPATGPIQVQAPDGSTVSSVEGVLPTGFVRGGLYHFSASGAAVSFQGNVVLPAPIQFSSAGSGVISASPSSITVNWTGGDSNSTVRVTLTSMVNGRSITSNVSASAGTFSFTPFCSGLPGQQICSFGIPAGPAQLSVDQVPVQNAIPTIAAQGLTQPLQILWDYRFALGGLTVN